MPFSDPMSSSISGRNSRASNVSATSKQSKPPANDLFANAGVMSMLKTSTDTGDIGNLSFNHPRLPGMPKQAHARRSHVSRPTGSSHNHTAASGSRHSYAQSQASRISSNTRDLDSASLRPRDSLTSLQTMPPYLPDTMSPTLISVGKSSPYVPPQPSYNRDGRSYSMTTVAQSRLPHHRSVTSLRSQGHQPREHHHPPPQHADQRSQYSYPTRLKRPGYRSPSPALSDFAGGPPPLHYGRRVPMPRPMLPTYHSDYAGNYASDPRYLDARAPPRAASNSPELRYESNQFAYHPGSMRSAPSLPMHHPTHRGMQYHGQYGPPIPHGPPLAHQKFHHAARMARQLPPRTSTPQTDATPSSSEPPSSAAPSSDPPTPRDHTEIHVIMDPAFIDSVLAELPSSTSEPVIPANYLEFTEDLAKTLEAQEMEVPHPSVPQAGFVQRVKAMLEEKAKADAAAARAQASADRVLDIHTPRITIIEEFEAPVELPASPVKFAELEATPIQPVPSVKRITRALVKAELAPSSTENDSSTIDPTLTTEIEVKVEQHERTNSDESHNASNEEDTTGSVEIPSSPPSASKRESVLSGSTTTISIGDSRMSGMSGVDYALRFSVPASTTIASEETQSKDPFALQVSSETSDESKESDSDRTEGPVSLLQPGEDVSRLSAVSPMTTQTLGIDETLHVNAPALLEEREENEEDHTMPGAFPSSDDRQPPPTPRTPKTYSKSVQLTQPTVTFTETTHSNRFSLPPDLSQIGESTVNTNSDMITDVAVRFSMPQSTITIGKPQIINISTSSTPRKHDSVSPKSTREASDTMPAGNAIVSEDDIAPLSFKKPKQQGKSQSISDLPSNNHRQVTRRSSPFDDGQMDPSRFSRDSTTDLRFSGINFSGGKYAGSHLPGLKEESQEDMSTADLRSSGIAGFQFPLPARIAAVKAMQERRSTGKHHSSDHSRTSRHQKGRPLAEIKDLPSLNFSRMDLIAKLNEALEVRPTRSMDVIRRRDFSGIYCPSPQRPASTEALRERYTSFFSKPEEFELSEEDVTGILFDNGDAVDAGAKDDESDELHELEAGDPDKRPLSPEELLSVATEVNRLSIPSVNGLTERLSNLLPSLKQLHLDSILANDEEVAHTIEDIHHLGHGGEAVKSRPNTILSNRSSVGLRMMAEVADKIATNGTHDSTVLDAKKERLNKELPPLPEGPDQVPAMDAAAGRSSVMSGTVSAPSILEADTKRPVSALMRMRAKSPASEEEVRQLLPLEPHPLARGSKRSLIVSSPSSRPWNLDESYPWSGTTVPVDISLPRKAHLRNSTELPRGGPLDEFDSSGEPTSTTQRGVDIGSIADGLERDGSVTTEMLTGISNHSRTKSKRSVLGSIKKKLGMTGCRGGEQSETPISPGLLSIDDSICDPGDRYPSTSLAPPNAFNLDDVRSFFSDNSSDEERHSGPFRKRLTNLKGKTNSKGRPELSQAQSLDGGLRPYDAGSLIDGRFGAHSPAHTFDGMTGMGKTEFRIKRIGERFKHLIARGSELLRSWSVKSRAWNPNSNRQRVRNEWLEDSLYSGA